jgi:flagellar biosynthetic protein FliO
MEGASDFGFLLWKTGGSLIIVLALLLVVAYCVRRWGIHSKSGAGNLIKILARQPLGPKHYLLLVQFQYDLLLLGVSPEGIRLLSSQEQTAGPIETVAPSGSIPEPQKTFEAIMNKLTRNPFPKAKLKC